MISVFHAAPPYVEAIWPKIVPGLTQAVEKSGAPEGIEETVKASVLSGQRHLHIILKDGEYEGFAITEFAATDLEGVWINIVYAYSSGGGNIHPELDRYLSGLGRSLGLRGIKFYSQRPGYGRRVAKLGYEPRFVEYVKELD